MKFGNFWSVFCVHGLDRNDGFNNEEKQWQHNFVFMLMALDFTLRLSIFYFERKINLCYEKLVGAKEGNVHLRLRVTGVNV